MSNGIYTKLSWDYIDVLNFTTKQIEEFATSLNLQVQKRAKQTYMEDRIRLPLFAPSFYEYVHEQEAIPHPHEYITHYYTKHSERLAKLTPSQVEGLNGRLYRTYASIFRDFHFYHYLKETKYFNKVLYVLKYDIEQKVDVFVTKSKKWYGIQLFVNSARGNSYYGKKPSRTNGSPVKAKLVPLPITFGSHGTTVQTKGEDLFLYGGTEFDKLKGLLN